MRFKSVWNQCPPIKETIWGRCHRGKPFKCRTAQEWIDEHCFKVLFFDLETGLQRHVTHWKPVEVK